jgi:NAD(P)-dependent dehydrogenase (short-subunit alcohol dehydrogenase family)
MSVVLVTGASSGVGNLTARALARAGHTVYASMRDPRGRNAGQADALLGLGSREHLALPFGAKPFRSVVDYTHSGVEIVTEAADVARESFVKRMGFGQLLRPAS